MRFFSPLALFFALASTLLAADPVYLTLSANERLFGEAEQPCAVFAVSTDGRAARVASCGVPFEVRDIRHRYFLERGAWMTPSAIRAEELIASGAEASFDLVSAGRVRLVSGSPALLLYYPQLLGGREYRPSLIRAINPGEEVLMPAHGGNATVAIRTGAGGKASAISKPFSAHRDRTTAINLEPPASGADLLFRFDWDRLQPADSDRDVSFVLSSGDDKRAPDVLLREPGGGIAIWYGAPEGDPTLEVESNEWYAAATPVALRNGSVVDIRSRLRRLPDAIVTVRLLQGEIAESTPLELTVHPAGRRNEILRKSPIELDHPMRLEALPPDPLEMILHIGESRVYRTVDLTDGADADVRWDLRPTVVTGRVTHGGDPAEAIVSFSDAPFRTDLTGRYRATVWWTGRHLVQTKLLDSERPVAFAESVKVEGDLEHDIDVPRNHWSVIVTDAVTGEPVRAERAHAQNRYRTGGSVMAPLVVDEEGKADLPALREGTVSVLVAADGYEPWKLVDIPVDVEEKVLEARLVRSSGVALRLILPDGRPAAGALAEAMRGRSRVWAGTADGNGRLHLSEELANAVLTIRHPDGGMMARAWSGEEGGAWQLPPAAPPLSVLVRNGDGTPAEAASIIVWIDGSRFGYHNSPPRTAPVSREGGVWTATNLPPTPLRLLAISRWSSLDVEDPTADGLAVTIPYPWPAEPVVVAVP